MASVFSTTATLYHVTPLPAGVTLESAKPLLHDHDVLIKLDPDFDHYEVMPSTEDAPNTKRYKVTDNITAIPKAIWNSTVTFEAHITNTDEGMEWVIKAPLGLTQTTTWKIVRTADLEKGKGKAVDGEEDGTAAVESEWSLVEEVLIAGSRLIVGTVKGKCEQNWQGVHGRLVAQMKPMEVQAQA